MTTDPLVSTKWLADHLHDKKVKVVDASFKMPGILPLPKEDYERAHIPGAFSCPRGMLEFWIDPASPYAKPIFQEDKKFVFHCASGWRSALAAKVAQEMGLTPVAHIGGGFTAWREAGGAVEKVEPKKAAGEKSAEQKK